MSRRLILQDFLPYLLNRAGMRIGTMFSKDIAPLSITLPMWRVLIELWHKGDHRLGELAERTSIDLSTLSRLLVTMQRRRLVVRRRSGVDRRALSLTLTEKGKEMVEHITPTAHYYEEVAMRDLSKSEIIQLKETLRKVFGALERAALEAEAKAPKPTRKTSSRKTPARKTPARRAATSAAKAD